MSQAFDADGREIPATEWAVIEQLYSLRRSIAKKANDARIAGDYKAMNEYLDLLIESDSGKELTAQQEGR